MINIDFQIYETHDPRVLSVMDYSEWGLIEGKPAIIEITPAGFNKPVTYYFKKGQMNVFNTYNLNLQCISECGLNQLNDLPDGIYNITVKGSPDSYCSSKSYLRTEKTRLDLDEKYINLNLNCDEIDGNKLKELNKIEAYLKAAEANVRRDNICEAQELFMKVKDMIVNFENKGC